MRTGRLMLLVVVLGFTILMPAYGYVGGRGGSFTYTPNNGAEKKINCSWTCLNNNTGSATTDTVAQCYAACAGACGNPCGPA